MTAAVGERSENPKAEDDIEIDMAPLYAHYGHMPVFELPAHLNP
nr:hypothetical protein [Arthrobacter polaris]